MTLLPSESWNVTGVVGPDYKVGPGCAAPNCKKYADHGHHAWRRSHLAGAYKWVKLWDDTIVQNLVGLCWKHHQEITENMSAIHYDDSGLFVWMEDMDGEFVVTGKLNPQPGEISTVTDVGSFSRDVPEPCPTCGTRKKEPHKGIPKRRSKTWSLTVPDDAEDGAEVLDTLCDELAKEFGTDHYTSRLRRYYTVNQAFALVLLNLTLLTKE